MPNLADTAAAVAAAGVPVLFLDTCSILDAIRAPEREFPGWVEAAVELVAMATGTPPRCSLVVGSFVPGEWASHDAPELDKLTKYLKRHDEQAARLHGLCGHLGVVLNFPQPGYATSGLDARLHGVSRQLLDAAQVLDAHTDTMTRAYARAAVTRRRPGHKGGELKDCTIFEECLEVCRLLQVAGFTRKMVFCTSNTKDYCAPGSDPHPDIAADCGAVGLRFTKTLPWAVSELTS